jgi:hypothetical protein
MSVLRPRPPADPIRFHLVAPAGSVAGWPELAPETVWLERGRMAAWVDAPAVAQAAALTRPERLLAEYRMERPESELYAMLQAARRIRDASDRVIVVATGGAAAAARAVFETCCHPFHNDLPRADRGGRPRLYFADERLDTDAVQGLLDLVAPEGRPRCHDLLERWTLVLVDGFRDGVGDPETAARTFLTALAAEPDAMAPAMADDRTLSGMRSSSLPHDRVVPVVAPGGWLTALTGRLGCRDSFVKPPDSDGRAAAFTAAALLPAAIVGVDVVRLLEGAVAMNMRLREAPVEDNPPLGLAALVRQASARGGDGRWVIAPPWARCAALADWSAVRDAAKRSPGVTSGAGWGLVARVSVEEPRRDQRAVPAASGGGGPPELAPAAAAAEIVLPRLDEHTVGQLLQMALLTDLLVAAAADASVTVARQLA